MFLVSAKGQNRDKSEFVTKFAGIIVTIISYKNFSQITCKNFAKQCFFTDHLKHKTVNRTTCRMHSANLRQLRAHWLKSFPAANDYFSRLAGFPHLFVKVFLITFKFSLFESSTTFLQEQCK